MSQKLLTTLIYLGFTLPIIGDPVFAQNYQQPPLKPPNYYPINNYPVQPPNPGNIYQQPNFRQNYPQNFQPGNGQQQGNMQQQNMPPQNFQQPHMQPQNQQARISALNTRYRTLLKNGKHLLVSKKPKFALSAFNEARVIKPADPEVHFWIGLALDDLKDPKKAFKSYVTSLNKATAKGWDSGELRINMGNTLTKLGYMKDAIFDYKRAIEINPTSAIPHLYLGRAYLIKEDYNLALDEFRRCEDLGLHNNYIPFFKSLSLLGLKQTEEAKNELNPLLTSYARTHSPELYKLAQALNSNLSKANNE